MRTIRALFVIFALTQLAACTGSGGGAAIGQIGSLGCQVVGALQSGAAYGGLSSACNQWSSIAGQAGSMADQFTPQQQPNYGPAYVGSPYEYGSAYGVPMTGQYTLQQPNHSAGYPVSPYGYGPVHGGPAIGQGYPATLGYPTYVVPPGTVYQRTW